MLFIKLEKYTLKSMVFMLFSILVTNFTEIYVNPANKYMLKIDNRNTGKSWKYVNSNDTRKMWITSFFVFVKVLTLAVAFSIVSITNSEQVNVCWKIIVSKIEDEALSSKEVYVQSQQLKLSTSCEICPKLTIRSLERPQRCLSGVLIFDFGHSSLFCTSLSFFSFEQVNNLVDKIYTLWSVLVLYQECVH